MLEKIGSFIAKICDFITGILISIIAYVVLYCVFKRYFLNSAPPWGEELTLFLLMWMSFLAASVLVREDGHIRITVFRDLLPHSLKIGIIIFSDIIVIICSALWAYISFDTFLLVKDDFAASLPVTLGWAFAAQPVCALLITLQALIAFIRHVSPTTTTDSSVCQEESV